jgi:hypothetical protein
MANMLKVAQKIVLINSSGKEMFLLEFDMLISKNLRNI